MAAHLIWTERQVRKYAGTMAQAIDKSLRANNIWPTDVTPKQARDVFIKQIVEYAERRGAKADPTLMRYLESGGRIAKLFDGLWIEHQRRLWPTYRRDA